MPRKFPTINVNEFEAKVHQNGGCSNAPANTVQAATIRTHAVEYAKSLGIQGPKGQLRKFVRAVYSAPALLASKGYCVKVPALGTLRTKRRIYRKQLEDGTVQTFDNTRIVLKSRVRFGEGEASAEATRNKMTERVRRKALDEGAVKKAFEEGGNRSLKKTTGKAKSVAARVANEIAAKAVAQQAARAVAAKAGSRATGTGTPPAARRGAKAAPGTPVSNKKKAAVATPGAVRRTTAASKTAPKPLTRQQRELKNLN